MRVCMYVCVCNVYVQFCQAWPLRWWPKSLYTCMHIHMHTYMQFVQAWSSPGPSRWWAEWLYVCMYTCIHKAHIHTFSFFKLDPHLDPQDDGQSVFVFNLLSHVVFTFVPPGEFQRKWVYKHVCVYVYTHTYTYIHMCMYVCMYTLSLRLSLRESFSASESCT
jgi:hypothetical protein